MAESSYPDAEKAGRNEDAALFGDLNITESATIASLSVGDFRPVIDANGIDRVFDIRPGVAATIMNL